MIVESDGMNMGGAGMGDTASAVMDDSGTGQGISYPVVPISPDSMIGSAMWKMVMYATGGLLLWSYLKTRHRGD